MLRDPYGVVQDARRYAETNGTSSSLERLLRRFEGVAVPESREASMFSFVTSSGRKGVILHFSSGWGFNLFSR